MTTLNSQTTAVTDTGVTANGNASAGVNQGQVLGASTVSTGLTNNFFMDSFFLPLLIAIIGVWFWKSGLFGITQWIDSRKSANKGYLVNRQLQSKIGQIKQREQGR